MRSILFKVNDIFFLTKRLAINDKDILVLTGELISHILGPAPKDSLNSFNSGDKFDLYGKIYTITQIDMPRQSGPIALWDISLCFDISKEEYDKIDKVCIKGKTFKIYNESEYIKFMRNKNIDNIIN